MMAELGVLEIMELYGSLGPDFLTWLLVRSERGDLSPPECEPGLVLRVLGPLVFQSETGDATKVTLAGEEAAASAEARAALGQGKRLMRARLEFTAQDAVWLFTLDGETFDFKTMKLPVPKMADADEYMTLRVQATQHLTAILRELFARFLVTRLDPAMWKTEVTGWAGR